jgi:ribosomal protein L12E/L44/L45/RPP1/RPP2
MPRATESPASKILNYFHTASMDAAEQLLDLCISAVKARRTKSAQAKARAKAPQPAAATSAPAPVQTAPARKAKPAKKAKTKPATRRTRRHIPPQDVPLPMSMATAHDNGAEDLFDEDAPQPAIVD